MPTRVFLACLACAVVQPHVYGEGYVAAVRFAHYEVLTRQYASVAKAQPTDQLTREFVPKFLALAQENPDDEAALRCCEWIIVHCRKFRDDPELYDSEAACWQMIGNNSAASSKLPALCLGAARHPTPARERFLRALPEDYRQPVEVHGYAFLALAELLAKRSEMASQSYDLDAEAPPEWRDYLASADAEDLRRESAELYQHVLANYAEIPYALGDRNDDDVKTLGELATKRLSQLENSRLVHKAMPNLIGSPTERFEHVWGN